MGEVSRAADQSRGVCESIHCRRMDSILGKRSWRRTFSPSVMRHISTTSGFPSLLKWNRRLIRREVGALCRTS